MERPHHKAQRFVVRAAGDRYLGCMQPGLELTEATDEHLAVLVQSGSASSGSAYASLYKRHAPAVLSFLAARVRDRSEAADLCQQVWLKVWERLGTHFEADHFRGWVFQMARNLLIDHHRKHRAGLLPEEFDPAAPVDDELLDERIAHVRPCVDALTEDRRAIVEARLSGISFDDISLQFRIPANTAMTRFHRAKDQLRDCIERRSQNA